MAVQTDNVPIDEATAKEAISLNSAEQAQLQFPATQVSDLVCPDHVYHQAGQASAPHHHASIGGIPQWLIRQTGASQCKTMVLQMLHV